MIITLKKPRVFAFVALTVCSNAFFARAQNAATPPASSSPNAPNVSLMMRLTSGFVYDTTVTTDTRHVTKVHGEAPTPMHGRTVLQTRSRVLEVAPDGSATVEAEFRALKLRQESGATLLYDYDSQREDAAQNSETLTPGVPKSPLAIDALSSSLSRIYAPLLGRRYRARVAPDGRILELSGVQEMISGVLDAMRKEGVSEAEVQRAQDDFQRSFGGARASEHFYSVSELPPLTPLAINEPWTRRFLSGDPDLPFIARVTGHVARAQGDEVTIYEAGDLALDVDATKLPQSPVPISVRFSGTHRGGTRLNAALRTRTSRLWQQYYATFSFASSTASRRKQQISLLGRTDYLIEVAPVAE